MPAIIKKLQEVIGIHKGAKIVVCGCGVSLTEFKQHHQKYLTIGVNDVPALFQPNYLLVTDHPNRFYGKRRDLVNKSTAKYLFTCTNGWRHPNIVHFELGSKELKNLDDTRRIDHFVNSPYVAAMLAYKLGAAHIGIIGVDFTPGHFYNPNDGVHPVIKSNYLRRVNTAYLNLKNALIARGVSINNLSSQSKLQLPKITISEFDQL